MSITKKTRRNEAGIALVTTMLLMLLMSTMLVGFVMLITSGQKLGTVNNDYSKAFYGSEAGMEKMTADLGTLFKKTYSPNSAQLSSISSPSSAPVISGVQYTKFDLPTGTYKNGYELNYPVDVNGNPAATVKQITSGTSPYQGMTALITPYTLTVTARTTQGTEVKLQRTTQTVGIPMFQFGVFSDSDLSFFPGPNFNFGGRTHTNGNLFLASGSTLSLSDRVTAVGEVIRTNLSNGFPTASAYSGTVNVTTAPGTSSYRALAQNEGSLVGTLGSALNDPTWYNLSTSASYYAGNIKNGRTGARSLDLGLTTLGSGTKPIDIIRRPPVGDDPLVLAERYFAQASIRVLLSDNPQDITQLTPCIDTATAPLDLSTLAGPPAGWPAGAAANLFAQMNANNNAGFNTPPIPLATSAASATYQVSPGNGYWIAPNTPIIKGFIKIEVQRAPYGSPCGTWKDVTQEVLGYGYVGRNINPYFPGSSNTPQTLAGGQFGAAEPLMTLALTASLPNSPGACPDVHPNAIIRLERVRDNPSNYTAALTTATVSGACGVINNATPAQQVFPPSSTDYWPNTLFDTREGTQRDTTPTATVGAISTAKMVTLNGVMSYVEVDTRNLIRYLTGALPGSGSLSYDSVTAPNNYVLYVSDRRGNYLNQALPAGTVPISPTAKETGEYGFQDFINSSSQFGCPDSTTETAENLANITGPALQVYGQDATQASQPYLPTFPAVPTPLGGNGYFPNTGLGAVATTNVANTLLGATAAFALTPNPNCNVTAPTKIWPFDYVVHANEARENPNFFFRRAVKIVNGKNLAALMNQCPGNVVCGLTIAVENPVYIQGDYNANATGNGFNDPYIATSVLGDAVTLLSNTWNDANSFFSPFTMSGGTNPPNYRQAATTYYRTAIVGGKGISFQQPSGYSSSQDFGTDGGVHNFLRYIESWGGQTLNYRGSIISLYTSRQASSVFKCCTTVYSPPSRGYNFDTNFLQPQLLPPRTPLFRDINTTGFTQLLLTTQQ